MGGCNCTRLHPPGYGPGLGEGMHTDTHARVTRVSFPDPHTAVADGLHHRYANTVHFMIAVKRYLKNNVDEHLIAQKYSVIS